MARPNLVLSRCSKERLVIFPSRRTSRVLLCAILSLILAGAALAPAVAALTGQLTGTVVDAKTQAPLPGVRVVASSPSGQYNTVTDAKGTFSILGVLPDTYTLSFELKGYEPSSSAGVTVIADSPQAVRVTMAREIRTIAQTTIRTRNSSSAFQNQTEDSYTVGQSAITALQGKTFNSDEKSLLQKLPSVTLDNQGTVFIRGGETFQVGYQLEGIDYSEPNRTLQNKSENVGNFNLLNGVGAVQLIPGGGDASHGNTGTGLISLQAKRGTYPGTGTLDLEATAFPYDHQLGLEYGAATPNNRFSYYVGFTGIRKNYQYGQPGTPGAEIGIFTDATNLTSINGANAVGVISTAADQESNDVLTNFIYKFGKDNNQYLQLFYQNQMVRQGLSYNGIVGQCYASCNPYGAYLYGSSNTGAGGLATTPDLQKIVPLYPGQSTFNQNVGAEDAIYSPFAAYKFEYGNNLNSSTYLVARYYRTFSDQIEDRPSVGIYNPENGGDRSAFSFELNKQSGKHFLQIGGQYEFVSPFGTLEDVTDYEYGYFGSYGNVLPEFAAPSSSQCLAAGGCLPTSPVAYDFLAASSATCNAGKIPGTVEFSGFGVNGPGATANNPTIANLNVRCGYLSKYFPNGVPSLPAEVESPLTKQQIYGYFAQDRIKLGAKATAQLGLRFDGYNFLFPDDPQNPPSIATVSHQRLFEPHVGLTRLLTPRDSIRATFGRTLSVPLPGLSGNSIVRSTFSAFDSVPSYDNLTGQAAHYCGINLNTLCSSYGDQLFWIMRDTRYPNSQLAPVKGATFTNYDFTYSHEFKSGLGVSLTPFFRRGYDIVEQSTTLSFSSGANPIPVVRPAVESNLGVQKATGIEALLTYDRDPGLSIRWSATYLNQLGNDPPLNYLSTASLDLGTLYRSQLFSPIQTTLALVYKRGKFRFNPILSYQGGYPYGVGSLVQVILPNGQPANVYNTNIPSGVVGNTPYCYVDPQYSGTTTNPNIAACTGVPEKSSAGGLLSHGILNLDASLTLHAPGSRSTYGIAVTNIFNELYGTPVVNPYFTNLIATGVYGPGSGYKPGTSPGSPGATTPNGSPSVFPNYAYGAYPYLLLPNKQPITTRLFYQVQL
jgi:hypothetical protein